VIQGVRRPDWRTGWNRLMRDVLPSECVVLTTVSTYLSHWGSHAAEQINAEIFRLEKARSNVQVVDWNKAIHAPDYAGVKKYMSGIPGKLFTDGIHENNGAGARWFATQYRSALARCQLGTGS
jgi:hypothetical protein